MIAGNAAGKRYQFIQSAPTAEIRNNKEQQGSHELRRK